MKLKKEHKRIFNSDNVYWSNVREINLYFLQTVQSHLNDKLKARGHLMLNEAYDVLGFPRTAAGAMVGWVYDENDELGVDLVDLGLNKYEDTGPDVTIIFNVNRNILDKLGEEP